MRPLSSIIKHNNPCGVAIDSNNNVYVADHANNRIQKFDLNGALASLKEAVRVEPNNALAWARHRRWRSAIQEKTFPCPAPSPNQNPLLP
jgi:hypothetical protein